LDLERREFAEKGLRMSRRPVIFVLAFFTLMYFFTEEGALPAGKLEFFWRFLAGPFNLLF